MRWALICLALWPTGERFTLWFDSKYLVPRNMGI